LYRLLCATCTLLYYSALFFVCPTFFFFKDTATSVFYTLSLHDALPIYVSVAGAKIEIFDENAYEAYMAAQSPTDFKRRIVKTYRSEEHTSELQSQSNLVCRLLLEKKKKKKKKKTKQNKTKPPNHNIMPY